MLPPYKQEDAVYLEGKIIGSGTGHAAGRALLARMYSRYVGGPLPTIALTERGKPYFVDSPWHFSISHTKRHVFCALSETNVGIDAEEADRSIRLELAEKILSPSEYRQYEAAADKRTALLTFWVLKEAQAKLTGEGIKFHPKHTDFLLDDPQVTWIDNCLVAVLQEEENAF